MRKSPTADSVITASGSAAHIERGTRSWMPVTEHPTAALDPRHWSTRGRQIRQWGLIEVLRDIRTLH
jgi:hypothetical protein